MHRRGPSCVLHEVTRRPMEVSRYCRLPWSSWGGREGRGRGGGYTGERGEGIPVREGGVQRRERGREGGKEREEREGEGD